MNLNPLDDFDSIQPSTGNYFISTYPPFSTWSESQNHFVKPTVDSAPTEEPLGLYIHIPFCLKKCDFCYYLSVTGKSAEDQSRYVDTLLSEAEIYAQKTYLSGRKISFIYFGGGTPSLLKPNEIKRLGLGLKELFPTNSETEISFECSPKTVTDEKIDSLKSIGVTRVSMGVQSFDNEILLKNGRVHKVEDVLKAYEKIKNGSFKCMNIDLMAGMLTEKWESWNSTVQQAIKLQPDSITVYPTEHPANTKQYKDLSLENERVKPTSWIEKRDRVKHAFKQLEEQGYTVATAYSALKDPVKHQFKYQHHVWNGGDMLGLGLSSYSYLKGIHFQNSTSFTDYQEKVALGRQPIKRARSLLSSELLIREFILALKFGKISKLSFLNRFGIDVLKEFWNELLSLSQAGLVEIDDDEVHLTREGLLRADTIALLFYLPEHQEIRYS